MRGVAEIQPVWLTRWLERHQTPLSFWLHVVGIPLTISAVWLAAYQLFLWRWDLWYRPVIFLAAGYALQFIGHWYEGNDLGEMILVKRLLGRPYTAVGKGPRGQGGEGPMDQGT